MDWHPSSQSAAECDVFSLAALTRVNHPNPPYPMKKGYWSKPLVPLLEEKEPQLATCSSTLPFFPPHVEELSSFDVRLP